MAITKTKTETKATPEQAKEAEATSINQWEFIDRIPARKDVEALLRSVKPIFGVEYWNYIDYVQAIPQQQRIHRESPDDQRNFIDTIVEVWRLYITVGGRIAMMQDIAERNDWTVSFVPEKKTPTGIPGVLSLADEIVYREYCEIRTETGRLIGRKPGTARVSLTNAEGAALTNPWEKVETAARGRSISAWGIGVLPGSGIASVEEVQGALEEKAKRQRDRGGESKQASSRASREELINEVESLIWNIAVKEGVQPPELAGEVCRGMETQIGVKLKQQDDGRVIFTPLKDGMLVMLRNQLEERYAQDPEPAQAPEQ